MNPAFLQNLLLILLALYVLPNRLTAGNSDRKNQQSTVRDLSAQLARAEKNSDLHTFLDHYGETIISMPEYQPTLHGRKAVTAFYREIFRRQSVQRLDKTIEEIIPLDSAFIEIGTFEKSYLDSSTPDSLLQQRGKYWTVWRLQVDKTLKITGEAYGFFQPITHPEQLVVELPAAAPKRIRSCLELSAYNALNERLVRTRDGLGRAALYTEDARFMPFQEPTVNGMDEIRPYLIEYNRRGAVTIDSIEVATYDFLSAGDQILEYYWFYVAWSVPDHSGLSTGKGIRIWRRQEDGAIRVHRSVSTHNLEE